ncbi:NAD(P)H-dependent FMN reductase C4B3.06c-like protein [Dipodascopsis tothii]|uniref:NAD(P)H-dependent FMN reductase C4B3.06c-like protein n=1 Tax=Dipodascopsis tothii TaxID=44089 RepID=UPI0034CF5642
MKFSTMKPIVQLIVGSTRPGRVGPSIASWAKTIADKQFPELDFEIVDLADYPLPLPTFETQPPKNAAGVYTQPETQRFSAKVATASAFLFLTPQYNWSFSAVLKNAIDHLCVEWNDKPAGIITWAMRESDRAAVGLLPILECLRMPVARPLVAINAGFTVRDEKFGLRDPATDFVGYEPTLIEAVGQIAALLKEKSS